jgi:large subunit ribosomal protein L24
MSHKWIKKDDKVIVTTGNSKGVVGDVIARKGDKIIVKGVNVRKKHMKARSQEQPSEIIEIERPIHISNVAFCDAEGNRVKVKSKSNGTSKVLVFAHAEDKELRIIKK